ncbi:GDSL-type esterase/lipase family protein [Methylobacterium sp. SD21]|uniref:GDSL-type esterase/lipase family protein n=1 Tax=Methylobacterium litchii TaxID=3138810 RepID=UPI00313D716F
MNFLQCAVCTAITIAPTISFACDQRAIAITSNPVPEQSKETYQQAVSIAEAAKKLSSPQTIVIGDSLVSRWPIDLLDFSPQYPLTFKMGVEGDKTQNVLWRLENSAFEHWKPKIVILLIGTNNLASGDSACAISFAITKIISRIDSLWGHPKLVLLSLLPRGEGWAFRLQDREQINNSLNEITKTRENTSVLSYDEELTCYSKSPCHNFNSDKLHLSLEGYSLLSKYLTESFKNSHPKL